jgi:hypothetical protein
MLELVIGDFNLEPVVQRYYEARVEAASGVGIVGIDKARFEDQYRGI